MEFFDLGAHCTLCQQKDYLPLTCEHCSLKYCKEHSSVTAHQCKHYKETTPKTQKETPIQTGILKTCNHKKCENIQIALCKGCNNGHCIHHRTLEDHKCKSIQKDIKGPIDHKTIGGDLKRLVDTEVKTRQLRQDLGYTRTYANKQEIVKRSKDEPIQFCNNLQTVWGQSSIDEQDRFYLKVFFPEESGIQPVFWYFNRNKVVGKVIDIIAEKGNVLNRICTLDDPNRLNLYRLQTGECIHQIGKNLGETLKNGDFVVLERGKFGSSLNSKFYDHLLRNVKNVDMWKKYIQPQTITVQ